MVNGATDTPPPLSPMLGYARVLCAFYAFAVALYDPTQCFISYFLGCVGWGGWVGGPT